MNTISINTRVSLVILISLSMLIFTFNACTSQKKVNIAVSADEIKTWMTYLASDDMKGRENGSKELKEAEIWLAGKFNEYGLKQPKGLSGYLQEYSFKNRLGEFNERNVIGFLEGADSELKDEIIVVSAHIDHVGILRPINNDSIYNGADDNASGTCTVLGIAKSMFDNEIKPGRSIVFVAFSGEEMGLQGSRYFIENPIYPLEKMFLNINIEMTGQCQVLGKERYLLTGHDYSNLIDVIHAYNEKLDWQLIDTVPNVMQYFRASDNYAFAAAQKLEDGKYIGIPAHTIVIGNGETHIHTPQDDLSLVDFDNMAGIVNHLSDLITHLSNYKGEIDWTYELYSRPEKSK